MSTKRRFLRTQAEEVAAYNYHTVRYVAQRLGVSDEHVVGLIRDGSLEAVDVGRGTKPRYRIAPESLEKFEQERKVRTHAA